MEAEGKRGRKGTLNPNFIEICPAARLISSLGTKSGETFFGPFLAGQDYGLERGGAETHTFRKC